jgi:GNAT superfamily N-acetyltransferase
MEVRKVAVLSEPNTVLEIAAIYRIAYGGFPWHEGFVCPVCKFSIGLETNLVFCPKCLEEEALVNLVEYWPQEKVISDFYRENSNPEAITCIAQTNNQTIGFAWGYRFDISPETEQKIAAIGLSKIYQRTVFYLDECAILPEFQGQGIGKELVRNILKSQPYDIMILRTLEGSPMQKLITTLGGEKIMSISESRIIMKLIRTDRLHLFEFPPHY